MRTINPMMPRAVDALPTGRDWTYEVKFDGYRAIAVKDARGIHLLSRTQTELSKRFRTVVADLARLPAKQFVLDGELVALDSDGKPTFQGLQSWYRRLREGQRIPLAFYVFDALEIDNESLTGVPLTVRRRRLAALLQRAELRVVLRSEALPGRLPDIEQRIRRFGLEGLVAKRRTSRYHAGERSRDWLKWRYTPRQEFVVGGYLPRNTTFETLLVGYYRAGELRYAGMVRSGFTSCSRLEVLRRLSPSSLKPQACPFADLPHHLPYRGRHPWDHRLTAEDMAAVRWVPPSVVVEVAFLEWGRHDLLRDGRFLGIREDKVPHAVQREVSLGMV